MSWFDLRPRARGCWTAVSYVTTCHFSCCQYVWDLGRARIKDFKLDRHILTNEGPINQANRLESKWFNYWTLAKKKSLFYRQLTKCLTTTIPCVFDTDSLNKINTQKNSCLQRKSVNFLLFAFPLDLFPVWNHLTASKKFKTNFFILNLRCVFKFQIKSFSSLFFACGNWGIFLFTRISFVCGPTNNQFNK